MKFATSGVLIQLEEEWERHTAINENETQCFVVLLFGLFVLLVLSSHGFVAAAWKERSAPQEISVVI